MKYTLTALLFVVTAIFPAQAAEGVKSGLELCLSMVIPSLFPLMFCSLLLIRTGLAQKISKPFSKPLGKLFALPECAGFVLFAAMCGGYPAGAAAVKELYNRNALSGEQAQRLAYIAVSAGPAFVLGAVGGGIYKSSAAGLLLLTALCFSVVITGIIVTLPAKKEPVRQSETVKKETHDNAFVTSALDAAKTLLSVCVFVVLFSCLLSLGDALGINRLIFRLLTAAGVPETAAQALLPTFLEVSGGCVAASKAGFPLVAFALGFGGLSVHFQIFSVLGEIPINKLKFTAIRLVQGIICAFLTAIAMPLMPENTVEVSAVKTGIIAMPTVTGSVCLVIMCLMAVMCLPDHLTKGENSV